MSADKRGVIHSHSDAERADHVRALFEQTPAVLAGNSVWVDRMFLMRYMPAVAGFFHYRMIDVTSVRLLVERWVGPSGTFNKPSAGEHDALVDTKNSIAELRHYRAVLGK